MYQNQYQQGGYGQPQNQNQNTYVGSAKFQNGQYGLMVSVSLNAEDIAKLQASLNQNGWVTFSLRERQQPSQSGATHYGVIRPPMPPQQGGYGQGYPQQNYRPAPQGQYQQNYRQAPAMNQGYRQAPAPQGYRQAPASQNYPPATAPAPQQGYDNGGFNQTPPQNYQVPQNYPPATAPAPQQEQHRYGPADAQPPADDNQEPPIDNDMPM